MRSNICTRRGAGALTNCDGLDDAHARTTLLTDGVVRVPISLTNRWTSYLLCYNVSFKEETLFYRCQESQ
jgi:hypothetical protein